MKFAKLLIVFLSFQSCFGQEPIATINTEKGSGLVSVVETDVEHKEGYLGTAVTAAHVIDGAIEISVLYSDGQKSLNCQLIAVDKTNDIAILRVWVPKNVKPIRVAVSGILKGQLIKMVGKSAREMTSRASDPTTPEKIFADLSLMAGDSGGPVLNENGELIGVISGGWFWYQDQTTWPARSSNTMPIRKLMGLK